MQESCSHKDNRVCPVQWGISRLLSINKRTPGVSTWLPSQGRSKGSKILQCYTQELVQITFSSSITPKHKHLKESVAGRIQCMNSKQSGAWNKQLSLRQAQQSNNRIDSKQVTARCHIKATDKWHACKTQTDRPWLQFITTPLDGMSNKQNNSSAATSKQATQLWTLLCHSSPQSQKRMHLKWSQQLKHHQWTQLEQRC